MTAPRLVFRPEAEAEALEARAWYELQRLGLGAEFGAAVDATVALIVRAPEVFAKVHG